MHKKNIIYIVFIICLFSCQPEQERWPYKHTEGSASFGALVFDVFSANVAHNCRSEKNALLYEKKAIFITNTDKIFNALKQSNKNDIKIFTDFIKDPQSLEQLSIIADFIELLGEKLTNINYELLSHILSLDNHALDKILITLLHDEAVTELFENLSQQKALDIASIISSLERAFKDINIFSLTQKILDVLGNPSQSKSILNITQKLSDKKVINAIKNIIGAGKNIKNTTNISTKEIILILKLLHDYPGILKRGAKTVQIGLWLNSVINYRHIPPKVLTFVKNIVNDKSTYEILIGNTKTIYDSGVLDDLLELINFLEERAQSVKFEQGQQKELVRIIKIAQKFFVVNKPILDAPVIIIGRIFLQLLAMNEANQCLIAMKDPHFRAHLKEWSKELASFMKDRDNGLVRILSLVQEKFQAF
jgi:hypothetical protein